MNSRAFSCAERSPLRHESGNCPAALEQVPTLPPVHELPEPGQSLSL
jgi:hypothetical protein